MKTNLLLKNFTLLLLSIIFCFSVTQSIIYAQTDPVPVSSGNSTQTTSSCPEGVYCLLEPLPGITTIDSNTTFADYANKIIRFAIVAAGMLAVVMIVVGGVQYMSTDAIGGKEDGKETISNAFVGLFLALTSFVLLNTINPQLTFIKLGVDSISVEVKIVPEIERNIQDNIHASDDIGTSTNTASSNCPGGVVNIPSGLQVKNSSVKIICKDLATRLLNLKNNTTGLHFIITSTVDGKHSSKCHKSNNPKTGNCADIALREINGSTIPHTDPRWGQLCKAVIGISGLDFLNEATNKGTCHIIHAFQTYANTTAPHLHIMYTGK